jgi:hypothetical protein
LHEQFGDDVQLTVGALGYPQRVLSGWAGNVSRAPVRQLGGSEVVVCLDGPLTVRSGHTADHGLLVRNKDSRELLIRTGFKLIADVVDPGTGAVVGGYSGPLFGTVNILRVAPGKTLRIPPRVWTDSFRPDLGYAIPPGDWGVQATLDPAAGQPGRTPILPLAVTA